MAKKVKKKLPFALLAYVSVATVLLQFLKIYQLDSSPFPLFFLAGFAGILILVDQIFLQILILMLFFPVGLYHYFPYGESFSLTWLQVFQENLVNSYQVTISGESGFVLQDFAVFIMLLLALFLLILMIQYRQFLLAYCVMLGYFFILIIFNNSVTLNLPILTVVASGLCFYLFKQAYLSAKQLSLVIVILISLVAGAYYFSQSSWVNQLANITNPIRTRLNNLGFYENILRHNAARSGFSENDQNLGGPLLSDNTVLFTARQSKEHYWRVESKNFYTGKGWDDSSDDDYEYFPAEAAVSEEAYEGNYQTATNIMLNFNREESYFPLPYGSSLINGNSDSDYFYYKNETGHLNFTTTNQQGTSLVAWREADYTAEDLMNVNLSQPVSDLNYLQLPAGMPQRVTDLAEEITADHSSLYQKVKAVNDYLKSSGRFRYSKEDAAYTLENQDYVDQFLFDTQVGYCNNFSSSMVVLLRNLDIPTRWVKGFAAGTKDGNTYTVTNNDAHSWVEVYFENFGWVPFDPTPTFSNLQATTETSQSSTSSQNNSSQSSSASASSATSQSSSSQSSSPTTNNSTNQINPIKIIGALLLLALTLAGIIFQYPLRIKWLLQRKAPLEKIYPLFLRQLNKKHPRQSAELLSDYAKKIEAAYPAVTGFADLTEKYEATIYGGEKVNLDKVALYQLALKIKKIK